ACFQEVEMQAREMGRNSMMESDQTITGLRQLLIGLRSIDGPKTLFLISEGFVPGDSSSLVIERGSLASAARTSIYALRLDTPLFDASDAKAPADMFGDRTTQG